MQAHMPWGALFKMQIPGHHPGDSHAVGLEEHLGICSDSDVQPGVRTTALIQSSYVTLTNHLEK